MSETKNYLDLTIPRANPLKSRKITDLTLRKRISMQIIFSRENVNMTTLKPMKGYFSQTLTFTVLNERKYKNNWLCVVNGNLYLQQNLNAKSELVSELACCSEFIPTVSSCDLYGIVMHKSKPIRISKEKASELLKSGIPLKSESLEETQV